ncbi:MAG: 50S ribosomal protein L29 [Bacteroidales bacterium]|nr:50S ribosomal protein L29 [Bacteroidales bacterium]
MKSSEINKEIKDLTTAELDEKIKTVTMEYTKMKLNHSISPIDNPLQIRHKRRYIARLLAEKRSRELKNVQ